VRIGAVCVCLRIVVQRTQCRTVVSRTAATVAAVVAGYIVVVVVVVVVAVVIVVSFIPRAFKRMLRY
jgi:hypothetical protein